MASYKVTVCPSTTASTTTTNQPEAMTVAATVIKEEFEDVEIKLEDIPEAPIMTQDATPTTKSELVEVKQEHPSQRNTITIRHPHIHWFQPTATLHSEIESQHRLQRLMVDSPLLTTEPSDRLQQPRVPRLGLLKTLLKTPVGKNHSSPMLPYARVKDFFRRIEQANRTHVPLPTLVDNYAAHCRSRSKQGASQWEMAALLIGAEKLTARIHTIMMAGYDNEGIGAQILAGGLLDRMPDF